MRYVSKEIINPSISNEGIKDDLIDIWRTQTDKLNFVAEKRLKLYQKFQSATLKQTNIEVPARIVVNDKGGAINVVNEIQDAATDIARIFKDKDSVLNVLFAVFEVLLDKDKDLTIFKTITYKFDFMILRRLDIDLSKLKFDPNSGAIHGINNAIYLRKSPTGFRSIKPFTSKEIALVLNRCQRILVELHRGAEARRNVNLGMDVNKSPTMVRAITDALSIHDKILYTILDLINDVLKLVELSME